MLELDHIAVLGETLAEAVSHTEATLGAPLLPGGEHPHFGTHNQLLGLDDGLYLEAIAVDPAAATPGRARWFGLDQFSGPPRLDKWVCRVPDLDRALALLPMAGEAVSLSRGSLRWRMAVPRDGILPFAGMFPALIEWQSPVPPGLALPASGARLDRLSVAHPEAEALAALLVPHLTAPVVEFVTEAVPALRGSFTTPRGIRVLQ